MFDYYHLFSKLLGTVPNALTTIHTAVTFTLNSIFNSLSRSNYLSMTKFTTWTVLALQVKTGSLHKSPSHSKSSHFSKFLHSILISSVLRSERFQFFPGSPVSPNSFPCSGVFQGLRVLSSCYIVELLFIQFFIFPLISPCGLWEQRRLLIDNFFYSWGSYIWLGLSDPLLFKNPREFDMTHFPEQICLVGQHSAVCTIPNGSSSVHKLLWYYLWASLLHSHMADSFNFVSI